MVAWLKRAGQGEFALSDMIDPKKGVPFAEYSEDESGENPRADKDSAVKDAKLLCDAKEIAATVRRGFDIAEVSESITCDQGPTPICTLHGFHDAPDVKVKLKRTGPSS